MIYFIKTLWGLLFRLFPCPTRVGLRRIGNPGPGSPVLVTCNFDLTVKRLLRLLRGLDLWLLVGESKGVNVWCAAGGDEFNTHSVVSVLKTSGIADKVNHRTLILPPLGAPGIKTSEVQRQTGWKVKWGPVYAKDIPAYINSDLKRDDKMKRVDYKIVERIDTALGSLFPIYIAGALGFLLFGRHLLSDYLTAGALSFLLFISLCPWIPGDRGITKAIFLDSFLVIVLLTLELLFTFSLSPFHNLFIIALVMVPIWGGELGGLASTMRSEFDAIMARLGIGALGNINWAGTIRTDLLIGKRKLTYDEKACKGCGNCEEVCPLGIWKIGSNRRAGRIREDDCTSCRACLVQCTTGAIQAEKIPEGV